MSMDWYTAYNGDDALRKDRFSPLDLVLNDPNVDELHQIIRMKPTMRTRDSTRPAR
jgi:zona occludens toxin (predicted ATPase)